MRLQHEPDTIVRVDIAYGGMWYAITDATQLGFRIEPDEARELAAVGEKIRLAARAQLRVVHPENPDIAGGSIVQFDRPFAGVGQVTRNTCIVAPGRSDRSPTGTGTCARMAVLHARGAMQVGESMVHESIIGARFTGSIVGTTTMAGKPAFCQPSKAGRGSRGWAARCSIRQTPTRRAMCWPTPGGSAVRLRSRHVAQVCAPVQVRQRFRFKPATASDPIRCLRVDVRLG